MYKDWTSSFDVELTHTSSSSIDTFRHATSKEAKRLSHYHQHHKSGLTNRHCSRSWVREDRPSIRWWTRLRCDDWTAQTASRNRPSRSSSCRTWLTPEARRRVRAHSWRNHSRAQSHRMICKHIKCNNTPTYSVQDYSRCKICTSDRSCDRWFNVRNT